MVDRVNMPSETPPEDQAHIDAMAAKGAALREGTEQPAATPEETPTERPAWLPEKFKSPEDMATAYAELEKKQGRPAEETPAPKPDGEASLEIPAEAEAALNEKGINLSELTTEYSENNGLSDETYTKLETAGFSRDDVNGYIAGQLALVDQTRAKAFDMVGGEDNFTSMQAWAKANLSDAEKAAFNAAVKGDDATREMAIRGLHSKYTAEVGTEGTTVHSNDTGAVSGDIFESRAQLVKAMNHEDYAKDPAYRKAVEAKLVRTRKVNSIF